LTQTRWQQIDSLGRTTSDQQAENGLTSFTYDDAGRVVTKTDSRGIVTTTLYDEINRPDERHFQRRDAWHHLWLTGSAAWLPSGTPWRRAPTPTTTWGR